MNKLRNAHHPVVVEILAAAKVLGCEILKVDLRRDWFHIRNGKEVRIGTFWKGIENRDLYERVIMASIKGRRIDDLDGCLYAPYLESSNARETV
jgi:hypothetical protein